MVRNVMCFLMIAATLMTVANATHYSVIWSTGIDYAAWTAGKNFKLFDTILLNYTLNHNVYEVSKHGYDTCSTYYGKFIDNSGYTLLETVGVGKWYIICETPGHCERGMKMEIEVTGPSKPPPPPPPPPSSAYRISSASSFALSLLVALVAVWWNELELPCLNPQYLL